MELSTHGTMDSFTSMSTTTKKTGGLVISTKFFEFWEHGRLSSLKYVNATLQEGCCILTIEILKYGGIRIQVNAHLEMIF